MNLDIATPLEAVLDTVDAEIARLQGVKAGIEDALDCGAPADPIHMQVDEDVRVDEQALQDLRTGLSEVVTDPVEEIPAPPRPEEVPKFLRNPPKPKPKPKPKKPTVSKKDFGPRKLKPWTDRDCEIIREMTAAKKPAAEIAKRLGRAVASIYQKKSEMGITNGAKTKVKLVPSDPGPKEVSPSEPDQQLTIVRPGPPDSSWSVFDDLELVRMFAGGSGKKDIAIVLERTQQECVDRFNGLVGPHRRLDAQQQLVKDLQILCDRAEQSAGVAAQ